MTHPLFCRISFYGPRPWADSRKSQPRMVGGGGGSSDNFSSTYSTEGRTSLPQEVQLLLVGGSEAFNSTSRYLDDLLNIDNSYFEQMVGQIYSTELQLNNANSADTEAPFLDLLLYVHSSFAIILIGKRELFALLSLSTWCLLIVVRLFLAVPWVCLQFVIVAETS